MALYRRAADLRDQQEIDSFAAELVDRFGKMPPEVDNLLRTIALKALCRAAGVEKIDAGPKGVLFAFRDNIFARPEKLIAYIQRNAPLLKVRPDQKVVLSRAWEEDVARLNGVSKVVGALAKMAA